MPLNRDELSDCINTISVQLRTLAMVLWKNKGHGPTEWEAVSKPYVGWTTGCSQCGEQLVVQYMPPQAPLVVGFAINMVPNKCGEHVWIPPTDDIEFVVWL